MAINRNQNLLFGLIAVHEGKLSAQEMARLAHQSQQSGTDLGDCLASEGFISEEDRSTLGGKMEEALAAHDGNVMATISTLWRTVPVRATARMTQGGGAQAETTTDTRTGQSLPPLADSLCADPKSPTVAAAPPAVHAGRPAAPAGPVPAVREHEGRYREIRTFAKGGMGRILLVHDTHIGREVALKQLLPEMAAQAATRDGTPTLDMLTVPLVARFMQEARITGQLEHPGIVPVYEVGYRKDGSLYYTMRLVKGKSLDAEITARPRLGDRLGLLPHFLDLCQAIAYAHSRGVIHRDIKPLNVLVGEFGETVVIDWGIAKARGVRDIHAGDLREAVELMRVGDTDATVKTVYGQAMGSPYYMPPEQAEGNPDKVDERSDVYALGAVLYAILTGLPPYNGLSVRNFLDRVTEFPPRPVMEVEKGAPRELAAVCARAMARKSEDRYTSARELAEEIQRHLSGGLVSAYEYRFSELVRRFVKRHRVFLSTAAAAAAALLALGVYSYIRVSGERDYALAQKGIADTERVRAEEARDLAEQARAAAETERVRAERELYFANIALARRALDETRMGQTRELIERTPAAFRNWEWGYLAAQSAAERLVLNTGGMFLAWSADGAKIATARPNGTLTINDARSGAVLDTPADKPGFGAAGAVDAAGSRFAFASPRAVMVWDWAAGREVFHFDEPGAPLPRCYVTLSGDGGTVAALNSDQTLRVWRVDTGAVLFERPVAGRMGFNLRLDPSGGLLLVSMSEMDAGGLTRFVELLRLPSGQSAGRGDLGDVLSLHAAAFSPDGALAALAMDNGCEIRSVDGWKRTAGFPGAFTQPDCLAFSPDGQWLAAGTAEGDLVLWNRASAVETRISKAHLDSIRFMDWSSDSTRLVTAGFDRTARLWEPSSGRRLHTFKGHDRPLFAAAFSPAGHLLATGSFDGTARLWDLDEELRFAELKTAAFHPATGRVAGVSGDALAVWDGHSLRRSATLDTGGLEAHALAFDQSGGRLAAALRGRPAADASGAEASADRMVAVWEVGGGARLLEFPAGGEVDRLEFSGSDGGLLVMRLGSRAVVRPLGSSEAVWEMEGVVDLACRTDGTMLAVCALDKTPSQSPESQRLLLVDTADWSVRAEHAVKTAFTAGLAFSPSGKWLALGEQVRTEDGWNCGAHLWDTARADAPPLWLGGHNALVGCVAFQPGEAMMATAGKDGAALLWTLPGGESAGRLAGHAGDIHDIAFSPDGSRVATAGRDGFFKLWDTAEGREILTLQAGGTEAGGQANYPYQVGFSGDGKLLFTLTEPLGTPPALLRAAPPDAEALAKGRNLGLWGWLAEWGRGETAGG
ncbi:MAG: protein kinase [Candidatus Hydrogenedens sp.]|nr:protein kinase [Candidatus Hydrogenedens sp.]